MTSAQIRVQIPAYTDHWMRGDKYGVVVRVQASLAKPKMYAVKLDRSGKTVRILADDCQEIA